ncbi:MAG: shikimate dehydrogenase [Actinobacteria bacterium]|nr:shikimate dehydrogenase [Actinomycetota bacterium]
MPEPTFLSRLTGSFATSAAQNPTVAIMEAAFVDAGLDCRYINCEVGPDRLEAAVRGAVGMGWMGFNCSIPHKVAVLSYLDELAPSAQIIGAVNTVVISGGRLIGENTDGQGFVASLRTVADPTGLDVVVLGAGGAARAIAVETALAGARSITIVNRTAERGEALARLIGERTPATGTYAPWTPRFGIDPSTGVVINATSIGFHPDTGSTPDVDMTTLQPGMVVADVVANPPRTRFLQEADDRGCVTLEGLGMLVNQALIAVRLWTGEDVSGDVMRAVLEDLFSA